jgi:hypothetical protein
VKLGARLAAALRPTHDGGGEEGEQGRRARARAEPTSCVSGSQLARKSDMQATFMSWRGAFELITAAQRIRRARGWPSKGTPGHARHASPRHIGSDAFVHTQNRETHLISDLRAKRLAGEAEDAM